MWLLINTTTFIKKINMTTCIFGLALLGVCVLSFEFLFFFSARKNSNCIVRAHGFTVQETKGTVHSTYNHFIQKKIYIKNGSHGTIHTFKNYFATVFSVFSKISCIRIDLTYFENITIDYTFLIFLTHMSGFVIIGYYLLYDA